MQAYHDYMAKVGDRHQLYQTIQDHFQINTGLYPGSHIDITPSYYVNHMMYVDQFKGTIKFFKQKDEILDAIKQFNNKATFDFYPQDYNQPLPIKNVDLIISLYAGFVGQATKHYLRIGGILLANDSHGDASLAYLDDAYQLIAVMHHHRITTKNLDQYFIPVKRIDLLKIHETMKPPAYQTHATYYIFRKIK